MINVAGHLREQNGTYQMILSWKDTNGKRRTKSISTGLPIKGNKNGPKPCCVRRKRNSTRKRCNRSVTSLYRSISPAGFGKV